jgi:hypothetical protein
LETSWLSERQIDPRIIAKIALRHPAANAILLVHERKDIDDVIGRSGRGEYCHRGVSFRGKAAELSIASDVSLSQNESKLGMNFDLNPIKP